MPMTRRFGCRSHGSTHWRRCCPGTTTADKPTANIDLLDGDGMCRVTMGGEITTLEQHGRSFLIEANVKFGNSRRLPTERWSFALPR